MEQHEWSEHPICPHCGKEDKEGWEEFGKSEAITTECMFCEEEYVAIEHVIYRYETRKVEDAL
jgi:hypothetical protein